MNTLGSGEVTPQGRFTPNVSTTEPGSDSDVDCSNIGGLSTWGGVCGWVPKTPGTMLIKAGSTSDILIVVECVINGLRLAKSQFYV